MTALANEIVELSKAYQGTDLLKFDRTTYDSARQALAQLIAIEAEEMSEGHDEQMSLAHLLQAVHHLFAWYEGEKAEGEVEEVLEDIELAAKKDEESKKPEADKKKTEHESDKKKTEHMDDEDTKKFAPTKDESKDSFMKRCKEAGMKDDPIKASAISTTRQTQMRRSLQR
jgi:hypothetical protein